MSYFSTLMNSLYITVRTSWTWWWRWWWWWWWRSDEDEKERQHFFFRVSTLKNSTENGKIQCWTE